MLNNFSKFFENFKLVTKKNFKLENRYKKLIAVWKMAWNLEIKKWEKKIIIDEEILSQRLMWKKFKNCDSIKNLKKNWHR